jgi:hypothetical protein
MKALQRRILTVSRSRVLPQPASCSEFVGWKNIHFLILGDVQLEASERL